MSSVRSVLSVMSALVFPLVLAIMGAAIALAVTHGQQLGTDSRPDPARSGRAIVSDDGETIHVTLDVAKSEPSSNLMVHGAGGEDMARFLVYQDGTYTLELTGSELVGFVVHRGISKAVHLGVRNGRARFALTAQPDGSTEMDLFRGGHPGDSLMYGLDISGEGEVRCRDTVPSPPTDERSPVELPSLRTAQPIRPCATTH